MSGQILIADDSALIRTILKKLLESHSSSWKICAEASDGEQAVQEALKSKPDLIILDFQMPRMDGLMAAAKIAKSLPMPPILLYTVHKTDYIDLEARKVGVREVIAKSDTGALLRAVEQSLGKDPNRTASATDRATT